MDGGTDFGAVNIALPAEGGASAARGLILLHFLLSRGFGSVPKGTVFPHLSFRNRPFPPFFLVGCSRGGVCPRVGSARGALSRCRPAALSSPHRRLPRLLGVVPASRRVQVEEGGQSLCLRMSALRSWQSAASVCGAGAGVFPASPSATAVPHSRLGSASLFLSFPRT